MEPMTTTKSPSDQSEQIGILAQEIAALHKKDQALQHQIQALISSNLCLLKVIEAVPSGHTSLVNQDMVSSTRAALESLKASILKAQRR